MLMTSAKIIRRQSDPVVQFQDHKVSPNILAEIRLYVGLSI